MMRYGSDNHLDGLTREALYSEIRHLHSRVEELEGFIDFDDGVLTLTIPDDPRRIRVRRAKGQPCKVYVSESDLERRGGIREEDGKTIAHAYIGVSPRIDWERIADELDEFANVVREFA